ncbi:ParB/RepB/Spo0J family partition protein [Paludisphaera sp.]|uniref:ParB/RepB/Spo0J family partition protein n=1 Tax=Paludisphaera sp. TaxID=2017432 RepID=UPI00301E3FBF
MLTLQRWACDKLSHGPNARSHLGSDEELGLLGDSLALGQQDPLHITAEGQVIDGNRRLAAARLRGVETLDCIVIDDLPEAERIAYQVISVVHRKDIAPSDRASAIRDMKLLDARLTNKAIAERIKLDASSVTIDLSLFDTLPEVQEAAKAGLLGPSQWYRIAKLKDPEAQRCQLAMMLGGGKAGRDKTPVVRNSKLRVPLPSGALITVTSDSLEDAVESLKEAIKAMNSAIAKGLEPSTAQKYWADVAKAR